MSFGKRSVLTRFSEHFPAGKISVVLGGSGAGKSTLLRLIGGLIAPDQGSIEVAGRAIVGASTRELRAIRDQVAMLFQGGALLDSLNVFDNIALPLREHTSLSASEIEQRVHTALQSVGLQDVDPLLPSGKGRTECFSSALPPAEACVLTPSVRGSSIAFPHYSTGRNAPCRRAY